MADENIIAAYARVSTASENQANSFKNQSGYFENAINSKKDLTFYKLYSDEGLSGVYWKKRDGFNEMLHDAGIDVVKKFDRRTKKEETTYYKSNRSPKFGQIWIKSTSRFARNTFSFEVIDLLREKGVYIYFLTQNIYTKDRSMDFALKMIMNMDENESRVKSEATKWGYQRGKERGRLYTHPKIFGWDYDRENNTLVKNEDAVIVKKIFDMYTEQGLGIRKIINELEKQGIKSATGNSRWAPSTIKNILNNEKCYGGNNSLKFEHGEFGHKTWPKPKDEYDVTETDKIEPIITKEQWEKAKGIRAGRCTNLNNHLKGQKVPYSRYCRKLVCRQCGGGYGRNSDWKDEKKTRKYYFYNCTNKRRLGVKFCDNPNVMEERLDEIIANFAHGKINSEIKRIKTNYLYLLLKVCELELDEISSDADAVSTLLSIKIKEKEAQALTYFKRLAENPDLDKHGIFQKMIEDLNSEIDELKQQQEAAENFNRDIYASIFAMLDEYRKIRDMEFDLKARYSEDEVLDMIDSIYVYKDQEKPRKSVLKFNYTIYAEANQLLLNFQEKYKFNIENQTNSKVTPELEDHVNTLYANLKKNLSGAYQFE